MKVFLGAPYLRGCVLLYGNHRADYLCYVRVMWPTLYLIYVLIWSPSMIAIRSEISRAFISKLPLLNRVNVLKTTVSYGSTYARAPILFAVYTTICYLNGNKKNIK